MHQTIPDGLIFGLLFLCGIGAYLTMTARTARRERAALAVLYLAFTCAAVFGAAALLGGALHA